MDLDEQELEATRNKSADKMFEELGYKKTENEYNDIKTIEYENADKCKTLVFDLIDKDFACMGKYNIDREYINIQELKAINKKVEELGW